MAYTATVNVHDIPTFRHGILLRTISDEEQCLERADRDYGDELLII